MAAHRWLDLYETCDILLRAGRFDDVREKLSEAGLHRVPREAKAKIAQLLNRVGQYEKAMTLLLPVIHPKGALREPATEFESATYALSLVKIGSTDEAMQLLSGLSQRIPERDLHTAFALQAVWDYRSAILHLRAYLARPDVSPYESAIAQVNLLAGLIATGQTSEATVLLAELGSLLQKAGWVLLQKNVHELSGQLLILLDDLDRAKRELSEARRGIGNDGSIWDFFITKWSAFVDLKMAPRSEEALQTVLSLRARALELRHWESVRECDRAMAMATRDRELFLKVYFGTPHAAYRENILHDAASWVGRPDAYIFGQKTGMIFDLSRAKTLDDRVVIKPGQLMHRCLLALTSDLYRPLFIGHMHAKLFPNDYFNPLSSVGRVANVVARFRSWVKESGLPLGIDVQDRLHRLELDPAGPPFGIRYVAEEAQENVATEALGMSALMKRLEERIEYEEFTSLEAAGALEISKSAVVRILSWGVESGHLVKSGASRSTKYRFSNAA